jgi:hypothetical protein
MRSVILTCISALVCLFTPGIAAAQDTFLPPAPPGPPVGVRAAGMSGAFTAVADDASAVYWNPGGLASGAFFGLTIDYNTADHGSAGTFALVTPPLGLSYYRTATGELPTSRNGLVAHHAGLTVNHSLTQSISVGTTFKLVQGVAGEFSTNKFDADVGVMAAGSLGKVGVSVHNLFEPKFTAAGGLIQLDRQVRLGLALNISRHSLVSADVDLTETPIPLGEQRDVAFGAEAQAGKKLWLRGGYRWNAAGGPAPSAPTGSVGGSFAVYGRTLADAQVTFGSDEGNRGWGVGLRFVF